MGGTAQYMPIAMRQVMPKRTDADETLAIVAYPAIAMGRTHSTMGPRMRSLSDRRATRTVMGVATAYGMTVHSWVRLALGAMRISLTMVGSCLVSIHLRNGRDWVDVQRGQTSIAQTRWQSRPSS